MTTHDDKVFAVFQEVLRLPNDMDRVNLVYNQTKGWDSIGHMTIVAGLEESFNCMLDTEDILELSDFNKATNIMQKHCGDA